MGCLEGRVAIVTGAGRGLGREHALLLAEHGASVVVNDLGATTDGSGDDDGPAREVAEAIRAAGGEAVANANDVSSWDGGGRLVAQAVEHFGRLDVLVNNAGILRDRSIVNMTEDEFDVVVRVHLKGHFVTLHHAAVHWREQSKAGDSADRSVINVSSASGLFGNAGQANYGAAKAGIAALTRIAAMELGRYGVRVNTVAPAARTRLTLQTPGMEDLLAPPESGDDFDAWDPGNVSPVIGWLASPDSAMTGETFYVQGATVQHVKPWSLATRLDGDGKWTIEELAAREEEFEATPPFDVAQLL